MGVHWPWPHPHPPHPQKPPVPRGVGVHIRYRYPYPHRGKIVASANGYCDQPPASALVGSITFAYVDTTSGATLTNTVTAPFPSGQVNDTAGFPVADGDAGTLACTWTNSTASTPAPPVSWSVPTPLGPPPVPTGVGVSVTP